MGQLNPAEVSALSRAAGLLDTVGRNTDLASSAMAVHSLQAADLLAGMGVSARTSPMRVGGSDASVAVREALRLLASLPDQVFKLPAVVGAVDAAQRALQAGQ